MYESRHHRQIRKEIVRVPCPHGGGIQPEKAMVGDGATVGAVSARLTGAIVLFARVAVGVAHASIFALMLNVKQFVAT